MNNILSIGCGIGIIEKNLFENGFSSLEVTDISNDPLKWLYLSSVEYFFNQNEFH